MLKSQLIDLIKNKKSMLCVGLDSDVHRMPDGIEKMPHGVLDFNKKIIDATQEFAVAYKINSAFYEAMGSQGWECMEKTLEYIPKSIFTIIDAKRGDIGNSAEQYRRGLVERMDFDAVTLNPYMGIDTMQCYKAIPDKWVIILGVTSNEGAKDFEKLRLENGKYLYEAVMDKSTQNFSDEEAMFVVGATQGEELKKLREKYPQYFFLIPGVGTQGGDLNTVMEQSFVPDHYGTLINASRSIIFASDTSDFAEQAARVAQHYQEKMADFIHSKEE